MKDSLQDLAAATTERLIEIFDDWSTRRLEPVFATDLSTPLFEEVRTLTLRGGKRIRAALLVHGGGLFEPEPLQRRAVLDAACALELLQTYFLIHDDVMDGDEMRRGGPAVHVSLAARYGDASLGINLAILAGDLAISLVQWLVTRLDVPDESVRQRVSSLMAAMQVDVIHGQMLDIVGHRSSEEVALHKTASYTVVGPLCLGATLCGASPAQVESLAELGRALGVAFQLRDDLIGAFGDSSVTGKPTGSDLRGGKRTFLVENALTRASAAQLRAIDTVLGRESASDDEVRVALEALRDSGAVAQCEQRIEALVQTFSDGLAAAGYLPQAVAFLDKLARFIAQRSA